MNTNRDYTDPNLSTYELTAAYSKAYRRAARSTGHAHTQALDECERISDALSARNLRVPDPSIFLHASFDDVK